MSTYSPDKNGYFVCKTNFLITNTELCKKQRPNKNSHTINDILHNDQCKHCTIDLTKVNSLSLEYFNKLEEELNEHIDLVHSKSNKPTGLYFGKL